MEIKDATHFISTAVLKSNIGSRWADLGCGSGVFTYALAGLLAGGSVVYAVDRKNVLLTSKSEGSTKVQFQQADFEKDTLDVPGLDGIMMANSLHYVEKKLPLLNRLAGMLKPGGMFLIIEYDIVTGNQWVPWPLDFKGMKSLFTNAGFATVEKTAERPSLYHTGTMYAATARV